MVLLGGATGASIIRVRRPKCGEIQARARQPTGSRYTCRKCGHVFVPPTSESQPFAKPTKSPKRRR